MVLFLYLIAGALIVVFLMCRDDASPGQAQKLPENAIRLRQVLAGFVEVIGVSRYQSSCKRAWAAARERDNFREFWAGLEPEPKNPIDPGAVRVHFEGETLGYLSRDDAETFLDTHAEAVSSGRPIFCVARPLGGSNEKPSIGIFLDFDLEEEFRQAS